MGEQNKVLWRGTRKAHPAIADLDAFVYQVHEFKQDNNASAGTNSIYSTAVPLGEYHIYTHVSMINRSNNLTRAEIRYDDTVNEARMATRVPCNQYIVCTLKGPIYMKAGHRWRFVFVGCTAGDDIECVAHGYKVEID